MTGRPGSGPRRAGRPGGRLRLSTRRPPTPPGCGSWREGARPLRLGRPRPAPRRPPRGPAAPNGSPAPAPAPRTRARATGPHAHRRRLPTVPPEHPPPPHPAAHRPARPRSPHTGAPATPAGFRPTAEGLTSTVAEGPLPQGRSHRRHAGTAPEPSPTPGRVRSPTPPPSPHARRPPARPRDETPRHPLPHAPVPRPEPPTPRRRQRTLTPVYTERASRLVGAVVDEVPGRRRHRCRGPAGGARRVYGPAVERGPAASRGARHPSLRSRGPGAFLGRCPRFFPGTAPMLLGVPACKSCAISGWSWRTSGPRRGCGGCATGSRRHPTRRPRWRTSPSTGAAEAGPVDSVLRRVVQCLDEGRPVSATAAELGLGERSLHRRCLTAFGYGPKTLARILRLRRALALARSGDAARGDGARAGYAGSSPIWRGRCGSWRACRSGSYRRGRVAGRTGRPPLPSGSCTVAYRCP